LPLDEIQRRVERRLGRSVPRSSIRSGLQLKTPDQYLRVGRGSYSLAGVTASNPGASMAEPGPCVTFGDATLHHADAFEWLASCPDQSIHGVVTDPPYGLVEYRPDELAKMRAGRGGVWRIPPSFDGNARSPLPRFSVLGEEDLANLEVFFNRFGQALFPKLVPGAHVVVASNPLLSHRVAYSLGQTGLERRGEIIRLVQTMRGGDRPKNAHDEYRGVSVMPRSQWEPWLLFRRPLEGTVAANLAKWRTGGLRRISDRLPFGDVIKSSPTRPAERRLAPHPSLKPQAFLREIVRAVLPLGEGVVLDPFAGSGSTLAAALAVGYRCLGTEVNAEYFELAARAIPALAALRTNSAGAANPLDR
jgi:site-specific DNA-methyltransferase (adenine-specific)